MSSVKAGMACQPAQAQQPPYMADTQSPEEAELPSKKGGNVGGEVLSKRISVLNLLTLDRPKHRQASEGDDDQREELDEGYEGVEVGCDLGGDTVRERDDEDEGRGHELDGRVRDTVGGERRQQVPGCGQALNCTGAGVGQQDPQHSLSVCERVRSRSTW